MRLVVSFHDGGGWLALRELLRTSLPLQGVSFADERVPWRLEDGEVDFDFRDGRLGRAIEQSDPSALGLPVVSLLAVSIEDSDDLKARGRRLIQDWLGRQETQGAARVLVVSQPRAAKEHGRASRLLASARTSVADKVRTEFGTIEGLTVHDVPNDSPAAAVSGILVSLRKLGLKCVFDRLHDLLDRTSTLPQSERTDPLEAERLVAALDKLCADAEANDLAGLVLLTSEKLDQILVSLPCEPAKTIDLTIGLDGQNFLLAARPNLEDGTYAYICANLARRMATSLSRSDPVAALREANAGYPRLKGTICQWAQTLLKEDLWLESWTHNYTRRVLELVKDAVYSREYADERLSLLNLQAQALDRLATSPKCSDKLRNDIFVQLARDTSSLSKKRLELAEDILVDAKFCNQQRSVIRARCLLADRQLELDEPKSALQTMLPVLQQDFDEVEAYLSPALLGKLLAASSDPLPDVVADFCFRLICLNRPSKHFAEMQQHACRLLRSAEPAIERRLDEICLASVLATTEHSDALHCSLDVVLESLWHVDMGLADITLEVRHDPLGTIDFVVEQTHLRTGTQVVKLSSDRVYEGYVALISLQVKMGNLSLKHDFETKPENRVLLTWPAAWPSLHLARPIDVDFNDRDLVCAYFRRNGVRLGGTLVKAHDDSEVLHDGEHYWRIRGRKDSPHVATFVLRTFGNSDIRTVPLGVTSMIGSGLFMRQVAKIDVGLDLGVSVHEYFPSLREATSRFTIRNEKQRQLYVVVIELRIGDATHRVWPATEGEDIVEMQVLVPGDTLDCFHRRTTDLDLPARLQIAYRPFDRAAYLEAVKERALDFDQRTFAALCFYAANCTAFMADDLWETLRHDIRLDERDIATMRAFQPLVETNLRHGHPELLDVDAADDMTLTVPYVLPLPMVHARVSLASSGSSTARAKDADGGGMWLVGQPKSLRLDIQLTGAAIDGSTTATAEWEYDAKSWMLLGKSTDSFTGASASLCRKVVPLHSGSLETPTLRIALSSARTPAEAQDDEGSGEDGEVTEKPTEDAVYVHTEYAAVPTVVYRL